MYQPNGKSIVSTNASQFIVMEAAIFKYCDFFVESSKEMELIEIIFGRHEAINMKLDAKNYFGWSQ